MSRTLEKIQKVFKAGKILSTIVMVCCIIGIIGCVLGGAVLYLVGDTVIDLGNMTLHGLIEMTGGITMGEIYTALMAGLIECIGEVVLSCLAIRFFKRELEIGTPFDFEVADRMKKLGIQTIVIPLAASMLASIAAQTMMMNFNVSTDLHVEASVSIGLGVSFLVGSLLCRYGAENCGPEESGDFFRQND